MEPRFGSCVEAGKVYGSSATAKHKELLLNRHSLDGPVMFGVAPSVQGSPFEEK